MMRDVEKEIVRRRKPRIRSDLDVRAENQRPSGRRGSGLDEFRTLGTQGMKVGKAPGRGVTG
jgi:hypothetical protein